MAQRVQTLFIDDLGAPRGALLYCSHSEHGLEEVSVGLMALPGTER
jgi:hypothetical protein